MALTGGDQVADRYRLVNRIAVGGMGEVWEARDLRLNRTVAIKVLKPEIGSDPDFLARFRTEAQISASLNHRGIAGVHDYGEGVTPDGVPTAYLVMELVHGEPLSTRLSTRGKLGPVLTLDLLEQTGRGLYAAHSRDFVHRDVKPGNILLAQDGTVKLTDFGIAKALSAAPVTESGMVMGTAHYIAPEQARGEDAFPASDVYSLAVVGYECLVGHRPFQATSPVEVAMMHINDPVPPLPDSIPPNVRKLIEIGLAKDPQQRYRNGGEFAAAVALVRRGQPPPDPGSIVVQSTSGALPAVGTLPQDRHTGPMSDGLALSGLSAPGLPPLPGNKPVTRPSPTPRPRPVEASHPVQPSGDLPAVPPGPPSPTPHPSGPMAADGQRRFAPPPSPSRGGRVLLMATFVLVTVAAVAIGVYIVRSAVRSERPVHHPAATSSDAPAPAGGLPVTVAAYVGKAATAAETDLRTAGLVPTVVTTTGTAPTNPTDCTVTDVAPAGRLPKGTAVTITCTQH